MKTFIFGAGASFHAGYPLASKLWPALEEWAGRSVRPAEYCDGAVDTMNRLFDMSLPFELALTELDRRIESPRDPFDKACLPITRGQVQMLICRFFDFIRSQSADLYRVFAQDVLAANDTVITFNYDVSLDRELQKSGKWCALDGYGFTLDPSLDQRSSCKLLKLHGSTNWIGQIFGGLTPGKLAMAPGNQSSLGRRPVIPTPELEFLGTDFVDSQFKGAGGFVQSLIMPAARKKFYMQTSLNPREWEDFWDSLWSQAKESIAISDELHIIGYSLPEYDERARRLLLETARRACDVSLSCRSDSGRLVEIFCQAGFADVHSAGDGSFENWLEYQCKDAA